MKTVGIIAEYNPFHNGHKYHLEQAKKQADAEYAIVIMSGSFVQRGTPAVLDKYSRARMALLSGADAVLELPPVYACGSAEIFAYGAVSILDGLGTVDSLCFGAETDNLTLLKDVAAVLSEEPAAFKDKLSDSLKQGLSFPAARSAALLSVLGSGKKTEDLLQSPNNILAIEYLKVLYQKKSHMTPVLVKRQGSAYNSTVLLEKNPSATALRTSYREEQALSRLASYMPPQAFSVLKEAENKTFPVEADDFSDALYARLLYLSQEELLNFQDMSVELASRIFRLKRKFCSFSQFSQLIKTRQYTLTRVQRTLLHILLDIKKELPSPSYVRLLGLCKASSQIIPGKSFHGPVTVITKPGDFPQLLEKDVLITSLYNQILYRKFQTVMADDYTHPLIIL